MNKDYYIKILEELGATLPKISETGTDKLLKCIMESNRIFVVGAGRSGLVIKAFAIRLMQMGLKVSVVGETTTPSIKDNDLLIIGSGSGETQGLVAIARKAKKIGSRIAVITMSKQSTLGKISDMAIEIPVKSSKSNVNSPSSSSQPMCNLFEQSLFLFLDALSINILDSEKIDLETLYENHANLE